MEKRTQHERNRIYKAQMDTTARDLTAYKEETIPALVEKLEIELVDTVSSQVQAVQGKLVTEDMLEQAIE